MTPLLHRRGEYSISLLFFNKKWSHQAELFCQCICSRGLIWSLQPHNVHYFPSDGIRQLTFSSPNLSAGLLQPLSKMGLNLGVKTKATDSGTRNTLEHSIWSEGGGLGCLGRTKPQATTDFITRYSSLQSSLPLSSSSFPSTWPSRFFSPPENSVALLLP